MTSPTAKVFDNQSTSALVKIGGWMFTAFVVVFLVVSGLGLLDAALVAPFMLLGLSLIAFIAMLIALPVIVVAYYGLLLLFLPFFWRKLD